ncbi:MAG TPA: 50S ribosomal protein L11 methyltransferase [Thermomicrobiaceae bacterium]|nr:50S ribosomal protein L11 methyltransferase [Thermomicrobiaceae bacterium]
MAEESRIWLEVSVEADAESVESVAELLSRYAYNRGVVIHEPYQQDVDGDNFTIDLSRPVQVSAYLPVNAQLAETRHALEHGLWHLGQLGAVGPLRAVERPEEDWANAWKEHFQVTRVGRRTVVRPIWRDYEPAPGDIVIDLNPGAAFGTGLHPTTALCLRWLEEMPLDGARVLDAGAGSGILSVAAIKLGAAEVDAVELDPVSVSSLEENVRLNGLEGQITVYEGDATAWLPAQQQYDLVLANILSRILIEGADNLTRATRPGGSLILSGVIEQHAPEVIAAYEARDCRLADRALLGDWVALRFERLG